MSCFKYLEIFGDSKFDLLKQDISLIYLVFGLVFHEKSTRLRLKIENRRLHMKPQAQNLISLDFNNTASNNSLALGKA